MTDRTLYVCRPVYNAAELVDWAKSIGLETTLPADDLHTTIAFSRIPFDWSGVGRSEDVVRVPLIGRREFTHLGDSGALVLKFESETLAARHQEFIDAGASWDHDGYHPHVTLTYTTPPGFEPEDVRPWTGELVLGPEQWKPIDEDWAAKVVEKHHEETIVDTVKRMVSGLFGPVRTETRSSTIVPILKADTAKQIVWGWASVIEEDGKPVVDHQGDVVYEADLLDAAHDYITESRAAKSMHKGRRTGRVVESVVFTKELQKALGIDLGRVGWFIGMKIEDDEIWKMYKDGKLAAFSVGGTGIREKL